MAKPVFEMALTAGREHIDELGHVNNAVWVQWIQQVAVAHWEAVAAQAHKDAYFWVVVRHEIELLCPVENIPEYIEGDLSGLEIHDSLHISSIKLPEGVVSMVKERDFTIASIVAPTSVVEEARAAAAAAGAAPGAATTKAPEKK